MNKKQKIGLVLGGGGAKGAYQVGVLKALKEYKIEKYINYISGTSIGSLNAVMYLSGGVEKCEEIWENINMNIAMSKKGILDVISDRSLFSRSGFIKMAKENIDFSKVSGSKIKTFVIASPMGKKNKTAKNTFKLNGLDEKRILKVILASSALPYIFDPVLIDGIRYMDGYLVDTVPVEILKEQGCEIIFVVPLKEISPASKNVDSNTLIIDFVSAFNDQGIVDGTLDFNSDSAKLRIEHGYQVGKQLIEKVIEEGIIAVNWRQKIRKQWINFRNKKKKNKKNYFYLKQKEIKHKFNVDFNSNNFLENQKINIRADINAKKLE